MNDNDINVTLTKNEIDIILASLPRGNVNNPKIRSAWKIYSKLAALNNIAYERQK